MFLVFVLWHSILPSKFMQSMIYTHTSHCMTLEFEKDLINICNCRFHLACRRGALTEYPPKETSVHFSEPLDDNHPHAWLFPSWGEFLDHERVMVTPHAVPILVWDTFWNLWAGHMYCMRRILSVKQFTHLLGWKQLSFGSNWTWLCDSCVTLFVMYMLLMYASNNMAGNTQILTCQKSSFSLVYIWG